MTPKEAAEYMVAQMGDGHWLYQEQIVYQIQRDCGTEHVYTNEAGNLAISRKVLKEFKKLTDGLLKWERGEKAWRRARPSDGPGRSVE
jgi:hypothetical protein